MNEILTCFSLFSAIYGTYCWAKWQIEKNKTIALEASAEAEQAYINNLLELLYQYRGKVVETAMKEAAKPDPSENDEINYKQLDEILVKLGRALGGGEYVKYGLIHNYFQDGPCISLLDFMGKPIRSEFGSSIESVVKSFEQTPKTKDNEPI